MLRTAVGRSGYGAIKLGENEGIGVACVSSQERISPTWTACVAHVKVDPKSGDVTLKKLTLAMDVGTVRRRRCERGLGEGQDGDGDDMREQKRTGTPKPVAGKKCSATNMLAE